MVTPVLAILVYRDDRLLEAHRFEGDVVKIGRDATCEIQLVDDGVMRIHGILEWTGEGWCAVDVEEGGEMLVHAADPAADDGWLAIGDMIQIGPYLLQVASEQEAAEAKRQLDDHAKRDAARKTEAEAEARVRCPACRGREPRVVVELEVAMKARAVRLDHPEAFSELRGEVCPECGHLSLFVDAAAIVPMG